MVFGAWTFPAGGRAAFRKAKLSYPPHEHDEDSLSAAFAGASAAKTVSAVMTTARTVDRFLRFDEEGDVLRIHAVLADDDSYDVCTRLGALARAAAAVGAKGHLTVLSDGQPAGRLVVTPKGASFDERRSALRPDAAGEKQLRRLWEEHDRPKIKTKTKDALTPAEQRAMAKQWALAEAKYRATWFRGKPEAQVVKALVQVRADFETGARAQVMRKRAEKAKSAR